MTRIRDDLRFALRSLARTPRFTLSSALVLSLGIGASAAIFSVVDHILLRPLDLPDPDRVVVVCERHEVVPYCTASTPNIVDFDARSRTLQALGAARTWPYTLGAEEGRRTLTVGLVAHRYFEALEIPAELGRLIRPSDSPPRGDGRVVVVRHRFWMGELGGDPAVLERTLELDGETYDIVGVIPEGAFIPRLDWVDVWLPLPWDPMRAEDRDWRGFPTVARLAPGADPSAAAAELEEIRASLAEIHPEELDGWRVDVRTMHDLLVGDARPTLLIFLAAVGAVLLVVCVNMASLLLTRATGREREMAVRSALGAGRATMSRLLLAESTLLGLLGGIGGIVVAYWATDLFLAVAPPGIPRLEEVTVDGRILAFALAVSMASGLLFGLAPVLRARRMEISSVLRAGPVRRAGRRGRRAQGALVVAELAVAVVLVTGSALLYRGFGNLLSWDPGFDTTHLLTFSTFFQADSQDEVRALFRQVESGIRAVPGVTGVGMVSAGPLFGGGDGRAPYLIEGRSEWSLREAPTVAWFDAGPGYFETVGIQVLRGRTFAESDGPDAPPVAVVNETFSRRHWPRESPLGARIHLPETGEEGMTVEIVGVVAGVPPLDPTVPPPPEIYFSNRQNTRGFPYLVVRTAVDPESVIGAIRDAVAAVRPDLEPSRITTLDERVAGELVRPRFNVFLVGLFAGVALVLGMVGVYGVVSYAVELRVHEIGVRMALGARRSRVVARIFADGLRLLVAGIALGMIGALATGGLLSGMLYGVPPTDALALASTVGILLVAGAAATLLPALRASRIDPQEALRVE